MKPAAITEDYLDTCPYPLYVQPKYDGIRCVVQQHRALSYNLKPIRNNYIRNYLEKFAKAYLPLESLVDGELLLQNPISTFQDITSAVMSEYGEPAFIYKIFDYVYDAKKEFRLRHYDVQNIFFPSFSAAIGRAETWTCLCKSQVLEIESALVNRGYEGIIIRSETGIYKNGRSTVNQGYLLKLKRFEDAEAEVIGVECKCHNDNELEENEHGKAKRSKHQEGLIPLDTLGAFVVRGINGRFKGKVFNVGSGFTDKQRKEFWTGWKLRIRTEPYKPLIIVYKYQNVGSLDAPRCPVFKGIREDGV